mmetsp:Transcript_27473/g.64111  ORF Transcript_27473/g.64111 Transcript_27473/m.64111 type:complete len:288 (+) Transcript_27473:96-959(+)
MAAVSAHLMAFLPGLLLPWSAVGLNIAAKPQCEVPAGMVRTTIAGGIPMVVYEKDDVVSNFIRAHHHWEVATPDAFVHPGHSHLPAFGTFVDIGANLGYYSLLFASQGYEVIAVEPMTQNRAALNASLCMNPRLAKLITVLPAALVADKDEEAQRCIVRSSVHHPNAGNGIMTCGSEDEVQPCGENEPNCDEPFVMTLDTALRRLQVEPSNISMLKMDVEGFECNVLKGGASLFTGGGPKLMQVETSKPKSAACVKEVACRHGYNLFTTHRNSIDTLLVKQDWDIHH